MRDRNDKRSLLDKHLCCASMWIPELKAHRMAGMRTLALLLSLPGIITYNYLRPKETRRTLALGH